MEMGGTVILLRYSLNFYVYIKVEQFIGERNDSSDIIWKKLPQSPFSSNNVNVRYRGLHPSYLGKIGLTSTSAGDPGVSGSLTPFLELPKDAYMHFTEKPEVDLTMEDDF